MRIVSARAAVLTLSTAMMLAQVPVPAAAAAHFVPTGAF